MLMLVVLIALRVCCVLPHGPWPQVLFDVGDVADAFYVIESGSLRLEFTAAHEVENVLQSEVAGLQPRCVR